MQELSRRKAQGSEGLEIQDLHSKIREGLMFQWFEASDLVFAFMLIKLLAEGFMSEILIWFSD